MYKPEHVLVEANPWSSDAGVRIIRCVPGEPLKYIHAWGFARATRSELVEGGTWAWELVIHL